MLSQHYLNRFTDDSPDTLYMQCLKFIVSNIDVIADYDDREQQYKLKEGLYLPTQISEKLFETYQMTSEVLENKTLKIFENPEATRLKKVKLRIPELTDEALALLLNHNLSELDVSDCSSLTPSSLSNINEKGSNLVSLSLNAPLNMMRPDHKKITLNAFEKRGYILNTPNLKRLAVKRLKILHERTYFTLLVGPLVNLTHLDLSHCGSLGSISCLEKLPSLVYLVLFNVPKLQDQAILTSLQRLVKLKHLDISQINESYGTFQNPNQVLSSLMESLVNLRSLDISGTNLAGNGIAEHGNVKKIQIKTDIPGLSSRTSNPLEFLGLYLTQYGACQRHDIPAKQIAGDANEEQILNAAVVYLDRSDVQQKVLNDLYHLFRYENFTNVNLALCLVLESMNRHVGEKHIQISGSATLFYIVKNKFPFNTRMRQRIIYTLLNGMNKFKEDETMMRNGCLTLCQFQIPQDMLFEYKRLINILLSVVSRMEQESFVQRIGIYLLNSLACQVGGVQKLMLGDLGVITQMLNLIQDRLNRSICDDVLEVAWSTMWNVTDETAINCERFLSGRGMDYFLGCLHLFSQKDELLRNMMGLLGNVAEVKWLRPRLMKTRFVTVFTTLLNSDSDGIEVSYNAAGVLAHMLSDGEEFWTIYEPERKEVLARMYEAIERWSLSNERNINYRSFEPILGLLKVKHTPECQLWAAWALANLTKVYPTKYCNLVEKEGGIELLKELIANGQTYVRVKELAKLVIIHCQHFKEKECTDTEAPLDG